MVIGFVLISIIILIKYKITYEVTMSGETLGYINDKNEFKETIKQKLLELNGSNVDFVSLKEEPKYELKLVNRNKETNEKEIILALNNDALITYKYFAVTLNDEIQDYVDTFEEATQIVEDIKEQYKQDLDLDLKVIESYTENKNELNLETVEVVEANLEKEIETIIEENGCTKINGIKIASMPLDNTTSYIISSRYGEISSRRSSAHTGLDLACKIGTDIMSVADGTVVFAGYNGAYGNLVKIDHGNGVQTWYAHCSKIYVKEEQKVKSGDIISAVGSTGNSTGPHLHFEIRIDGKAVNPQIYVYN